MWILMYDSPDTGPYPVAAFNTADEGVSHAREFAGALASRNGCFLEDYWYSSCDPTSGDYRRGDERYYLEQAPLITEENK